MDIIKYPRTQHIQGSRLQVGDEDLEQVPVSELVGKHLVIEEKQDGANSGISFDNAAKLHLQTRGHFMHGGIREGQFTLMKQWATTFADDFYCAIGDQYIMYGEWLFKKHTVFYDHLDHYWAEFDVYDKAKGVFLDTPNRLRVLKGLPICPVKILWQGTWTADMRFMDFIVNTNSHFKSPFWKVSLKQQVDKFGFDWDLVWKTTDKTDMMEGIYVKWEEDGIVKGRYKFVRPDFVSLITGNDTHHEDLPPVPNMLGPRVDIFNFPRL